MNYVKLSKEMSYLLRHHPEALNLNLDDQGFVAVSQLLKALNDEGKYDKKITRHDLDVMMAQSEKKRYEIVDDKIRATYGQSFQQKVKLVEANPPEILYHGTAWRFLDGISRKGLLPMKRQKVCLSVDVASAEAVGRRHEHGGQPAILLVHAKEAQKAGVKFYPSNDTTWQSDPIPRKFLVFPNEIK